LPIFCFLKPIARIGLRARVSPEGAKAQKIGGEKQARPLVRPHIDGASLRIACGGARPCDPGRAVLRKSNTRPCRPFSSRPPFRERSGRRPGHGTERH
jgi:hypothetical protein